MILLDLTNNYIPLSKLTLSAHVQLTIQAKHIKATGRQFYFSIEVVHICMAHIQGSTPFPGWEALKTISKSFQLIFLNLLGGKKIISKVTSPVQ